MSRAAERPSLAPAARALLTTDARFPRVGPTPEESDVATVLGVIEAEHQGDADDPGPDGSWGRCIGCGQRWPCERFADGEALAVEYLGRAADRVYQRARTAMNAAQPPLTPNPEGTPPG